jgi:hypothetical protein
MKMTLSMNEVKFILRQHFNLTDDVELDIQSGCCDSPDNEPIAEYQEVPRDWYNFFAPDGFPTSGKVEIVRRDGESFIADAEREINSAFWMQDSYDCDEYVKFRKVKG